jgi:hypothetical protein
MAAQSPLAPRGAVAGRLAVASGGYRRWKTKQNKNVGTFSKMLTNIFTKMLLKPFLKKCWLIFFMKKCWFNIFV